MHCYSMHKVNEFSSSEQAMQLWPRHCPPNRHPAQTHVLWIGLQLWTLLNNNECALKAAGDTTVHMPAPKKMSCTNSWSASNVVMIPPYLNSAMLVADKPRPAVAQETQPTTYSLHGRGKTSSTGDYLPLCAQASLPRCPQHMAIGR